MGSIFESVEFQASFKESFLYNSVKKKVVDGLTLTSIIKDDVKLGTFPSHHSIISLYKAIDDLYRNGLPKFLANCLGALRISGMFEELNFNDNKFEPFMSIEIDDWLPNPNTYRFLIDLDIDVLKSIKDSDIKLFIANGYHSIVIIHKDYIEVYKVSNAPEGYSCEIDTIPNDIKQLVTLTKESWKMLLRS